MNIEKKLSRATFRVLEGTAIAATVILIPRIVKEASKIKERKKIEEIRLNQEIREINLTNLQSGDSGFNFVSK
jgi:hypothetical protein